MTAWFARACIYWILMFAPVLIMMASQHGLIHKHKRIGEIIENITAMLIIPGLIFTIMPALGWLSYLFPTVARHEVNHTRDKLTDVIISNQHVYGSLPISNHDSMNYAIGVLEPIIGIMLMLIIMIVMIIRTIIADNDNMYE